MHKSIFLAIGALSASAANAVLIVNPPQPIVERVNVNVIHVADDDGNNAAPLFGTMSEQSSIFSLVDTIWAQAGIDVDFSFLSGTYDNTFALTGTPGVNNPRPTSDLGTIVSDAQSEGGILSADPNTINLFMVRIVPGFSQTLDDTANGLAFVDGNGVTMWAGPDLPDHTSGQEVIAGVLAHEIGHNLGLHHISEIENLMLASGGAGERLNTAQIDTALLSPFSVPIPEPTSLALLGLTTILLRRR